MTDCEILDKFLGWFVENNIHHVSKDDVSTKIINDIPEINTISFLLYQDLIFDKLVKENYIKKENGLFSITFEGRELYRKGGFGKKYKKEIWEAAPKKNWLVYDILKILFGVVIGLIATLLLKKLQ